MSEAITIAVTENTETITQTIVENGETITLTINEAARGPAGSGSGSGDVTAAAALPVNSAIVADDGAKGVKGIAMAASTFLARLASGDIVAATVAQIKTLLGLGSAAYTGSGDYATAAKFVAGAGALTGPASPLTIGTAAAATLGTGTGQVPVTGNYAPASTVMATAPVNAARAFGTLTFHTGALTVGNIVTVNGVTFTAVANEATPTGDQFKIGTSYDDAADNLLQAIQAHAGYGDTGFPVDANTDSVGSTYVLTVTSIYYTTSGNSVGFTKTADNINISAGGTLTGGTAGTAATCLGHRIFVGSTPGSYVAYECEQLSPVIWAISEVTEAAVIAALGFTPMPNDHIVASATTEQFVSAIDTLLQGLTASASTKNIFSTLNHAAPTYVRSTTCWASTVDLTPVSVWNSRNVGDIGLVLITPTKALGVNHSVLLVNDTVRFVTAANGVETRTITAANQIGTLDLCVYTLNTEITTITPASWAELPHAVMHGMPLIGVNQDQEAIVHEFSHYNPNRTSIYWHSTATMSDARSQWNEDLITGDSGYPLCAVLENRLVLFALGSSGYSGLNLLNATYRGLVETQCGEGAFTLITGSSIKALEIGVLPISAGGTGATTAALALTALGAMPGNTAVASRREIKTTAFTAAVYGSYAANGTFSVTDPATALINESYEVLIIGGAVTIGGLVYSATKFPVRRVCTNATGPVWATSPSLLYSLEIGDNQFGFKASCDNLGKWTAQQYYIGTTISIGGSDISLKNNYCISFSSTSAWSGAADASMSRISAGLVGFGTGAQGSIAGSISCLNATFGGTLGVTGATTCTGLATFNGGLAGVSQALSGNGAVTAVSLSTLATTIANTGTADTTTTLAAGTDGQIKTICFITDGGFNAVVTVTNPAWGGAGTITMNDANDLVLLQYLGSKWQVLSNSGCTLA